MLALEEVGSSLTRVKKWGDGLVGGATMHTTALYLKTNSFTISIMHFIGSSTKQHKKERKKSVSIEPSKASFAVSRQPVCPPRAPHWARLPRHLAGSSCPHRRSVKKS